VNAPFTLGLPEITPVLDASVSPAGSAPAVIDHVYGGVPPDAASVVLYATPCVPFGNALVVITRAGGFIVRLNAALAF
jgi:hypothetical protein